jgi:AraC family transcriptional activator of pyochelin receptor
MYQLTGNNFGDLITRKFTTGPVTTETSGLLKNVFSCKSRSIRTNDFDILHFTASFKEEIRVNGFHDTTHVSMHFQQGGRSSASITGLSEGQQLRGGQFNVLNCIDPVSSFDFPKQSHYAYTCIGLDTDFFNIVLQECGTFYQNLLTKSMRREPFTLFSRGAIVNHLQISSLQLVQNPPVADNLKITYIRSKVKELILLSLDTFCTAGDNKKDILSEGDIEKLCAVKEYLAQQYLSKLTLEGISRAFLLNEFKLKKGFKALFGSTVFGYIHELRMRHAHDLMHAGGLSVGEIAGITGYSSDSSFIRAFRCFYGHSPSKTFKF